MKPLYIWAGGKNKMIKKYKDNPSIPLSGYDTFVEPFFGGGAMTIYIYENAPHVKRFVINDIKPELIAIYQSIKNDCDNFCARMDDLTDRYLPLSKEKRKEFFYALRHEHAYDYEKWSKTEEAATLYFLMKTGFNGIYQLNNNTNQRYGTPCGLLDQTDKVYDKDNVLEWNKFLQKAELKCGDWYEASKDETNAFFFFDPPYRESFTQYGEGFCDVKQKELIDFCIEKSDNNIVFLCNRDDGNDDFFEKNKANLKASHYDVTYTAGRRKKENDGYSAKKAREILLHNVQTNDLQDFFN